MFKNNKEKSLLAGLCAGIGEDWNIDPLWIRAFFVLIFFHNPWFSAILYVVLSIIGA